MHKLTAQMNQYAKVLSSISKQLNDKLKCNTIISLNIRLIKYLDKCNYTNILNFEANLNTADYASNSYLPYF